jgi:hypothetical protein
MLHPGVRGLLGLRLVLHRLVLHIFFHFYLVERNENSNHFRM